MALEETRGYCDDCERWVGINRRGMTVPLHLFLAIVTVGLWLPVYWVLLKCRDNWQCALCRSFNVRTRKQQEAHWRDMDENLNEEYAED